MLTILLALAQPPPAVEIQPPTEVVAAAPAPWRFAIAPSVGLVVPTSKLGATVVGGLELDLALPVLERRLVLALDASITHPTHSGTGTDARVGGAYSYDVGVTEFKVGLDLVFRFLTADRPIVPYLGVGPILHMLRTTETTDLAPGDNTEQNTKVGVEVVGGVDFRLGPGMLLGEVRWVYSTLDHLWTGETNAGNVTVGVGYRFVF